MWKPTSKITAKRDDDGPPKFSFGFRMTKTGATIVMDVFGNPQFRTYLQDIQEAHRMAKRRYELEAGSGQVSSTPLFFTSCGNCGRTILTNRERDSRFKCAMCESPTVATESRTPDYDRILAELDKLLGLRRMEAYTTSYLFIIQPSSDRLRDPTVLLCKNAGFVAITDERRPMAAYLVNHAISQLAMKQGRRVEAFEKRLTIESAYGGETPPEIDKLSKSLRLVDPDLRSLSFEIPRPSTDPTELIAQGDYTTALEVINGRLLRDPQNVQLLIEKAQVLLIMRKIDEADQIARLLIQVAPRDAMVWTVAGQVADAQQNLSTAISCYERVLKLDPSDRHAMELLALNYQKAGDSQRAAEYRTRVRSLGGYYNAR